MSRHLVPILYTVFAWWFSTGVILWLDGLPRSTHKWSMFWATVLLGVALAGLVASSDDLRTSGACIAFTCALVVWGWSELALLTGFVTGPRRDACPAGARGWRRAGFALQAILWHELALVALGIVVIALTWRAPNPVAACTYTTLWVMRVSAKVNVFLGVRNLSEEFLPPRLRYLATYFRTRTMNPVYPLSLLLSGALAVALWDHALASTTQAFGATASAFVATLMSLALLEHLFMMLPFPAERLWRWGLRSRRPGAL